MRALLIGLLCVSTLSACNSGPRRVDPTDMNESTTSMGLDYVDIVNVAGSMCEKLVGGGFLNNPPYSEAWPVKMVLSDINNKTDIRNLPTEAIVQRVREAALDSGKVRFISTFGGGPTDSIAKNAQDIADDPRFRRDQAPKAGGFTVPQLSLQTEILYFRSSDGRTRQNTYEVHMFVTELETGEIVWEKSSGPVSKQSKKGSFGG